MCLGVPGKVVAVDGAVASVDFWGIRRQIRLDLVDMPVAPGDYVLNHVGYAIRRIPDEEIPETLALYETLLAAARAEDAEAGTGDLMQDDILGEIAAAGLAPPAGGAP